MLISSQKYNDGVTKLFNFQKPDKNIGNIVNKINMIIYNYIRKTETKYDNKKLIFSILNETRNSMLYFHTYHEIIIKRTKNFKLR